MTAVIPISVYLEWASDDAPTAEEYFRCGGTLAAVVLRVKELIALGTIAEDVDLRNCVRRKLLQSADFVERRPVQPVQSALLTRIFQVFSSQKSDAEYLNEARALWASISGPASPLTVAVIAAPERSLAEVVQTVIAKVIQTELFQHNQFYRDELRYQLYLRAKRVWEDSSSSLIYGMAYQAAHVFNAAIGKKTSFELACIIIKLIDQMDGKFVVPPEKSLYDQREELVFKNSAWLTDDLLLRFATAMPSVKRIKAVGCFLLTAEGVARAEHSRRVDRFGRYNALEISTGLSDDWVVVYPADWRKDA